MKLYAYLIFALEFEKFYKCGLQALKVYYYLKVYSNVQSKLDSKSKNRAINKLEAAGLIEVRRNGKQSPLLKIINEVGPAKMRDQSKLRFGGANKKEFKIERSQK